MVGERQRLLAAIELPSDVYQPMTSVSSSLLLLGGMREAAYFDVLSSRGDLLEVETRPWLISLSAWLRGEQSQRGFTAPTSGLNAWSAAPNDPEIARIKHRLARLGPMRPLRELCDVFLNQSQGGNCTVISARLLTSAGFDRLRVVSMDAPQALLVADSS